MNDPSRPLKRAIVARARCLRSESTEAENKLWNALRNRQVDGAKFRRQVPIGRYFADFCCHHARLIVEVDGSQHAEQVRYDAARTADLEGRGFRVLRFWNADVLKALPAVTDIIREELHRKR